MLLLNEQSLPDRGLKSLSTGLGKMRQTLILAVVQKAENFIFYGCVLRCYPDL